MKLAAYTRVSTDRQAEEGLGLDVQAQSIRTWAKANGHRVVAWYSDEGVSGSNGIESRVALIDAMDMLKAGRAGGLAVSRLDRLARDLILQENMLREIWHVGAEVFTTSAAEAAWLKRDDPDDPARQLIREVLGSVAAYERRMIAARTRAGRRRKAETGGFAYGSPGYGMKAEGGELVPNPAEQPLVERVRQLRSTIDPETRKPTSYRAICTQLEAEGFRPRRAERWYPAVVRRIAERTT